MRATARAITRNFCDRLCATGELAAGYERLELLECDVSLFFNVNFVERFGDPQHAGLCFLERQLAVVIDIGGSELCLDFCGEGDCARDIVHADTPRTSRTMSVRVLPPRLPVWARNTSGPARSQARLNASLPTRMRGGELDCVPGQSSAGK